MHPTLYSRVNRGMKVELARDHNVIPITLADYIFGEGKLGAAGIVIVGHT